jgi:hypothetical protein
MPTTPRRRRGQQLRALADQHDRQLGPARREQFGIARDEELFDPPTNARAAHSVFTTPPRGFANWTTFKKGLHKQHLGAARQAAQQAGEPGFVDVEEVDVTEEELRKVVNEEVTRVLNKEAVKVFGVTSWENYLEALLKAARQD